MARPKGSPKVGGRVKGTPNKTTASMKAAFESVYRDLQDKHGDGTPNGHFLSWALDNETDFYKLASKLIPVQLTGEGGGPVQHEFVTKQQRDAAVKAAMDADT